MHPDYRNMSYDQDSYRQALVETLSIFRVDLSNYVLRLPPKYVQMLKDPLPGVYMNGSINPHLVFDGQPYYSQKVVSRKFAQPDVHRFSDVWNVKGSIYNNDGVPVFTVMNGLRQYYNEYPTFHPSAIYIAYIYALEMFRYLNPLAQPYSNLDRDFLDLRKHVKPEYLPNFNGSYDDYLQTRGVTHFYDEDNGDLLELGVLLRNFIGQDKYNVYRFYLSNTTLTIEKGNDFRVIEYYRLILNHISEM